MRRLLAAAVGIAILTAASAGSAQTVYPIDRADILAGSRFDLKVEFAGLADPAKVSVTLNGEDHAKLFGKSADFVAREDGKDQSALILRDVSLTQPGLYKIRVTDGAQARELSWNVYDTGPRKAKNVILFIGDGMSLAHRVAARVLAKGIAEGKAFGKLAIDDMPQMALVATAGSDSIITDSANSASAYATGHKTAVNAMGVYADRTPDPLDDPKVETITSLAKRRLGMAVGIVTNTEVEDATPAAMVAHIRRRSE
jgi:alkaline phosphatase